MVKSSAALDDFPACGCHKPGTKGNIYDLCVQERERVHWEEQRKAMQADQYNKAELALESAQMSSMTSTVRDKCSLFGPYNYFISQASAVPAAAALKLSSRPDRCNCLPAGCKRRVLLIRKPRSSRSRRR